MFLIQGNFARKSIEVILFEDKFNSFNFLKLTFANTSTEDNWFVFKNKWFREGKSTLERASIDVNLLVLKSKAINFLPKLLFAQTLIF